MITGQDNWSDFSQARWRDRPDHASYYKIQEWTFHAEQKLGFIRPSEH